MNYYFNYRNRIERIFKKSSNAELIIFFNSQVKNGGWCHAKMIFLDCLKEEIRKRFDASKIINNNRCSYLKRICLKGNKIYKL